MAPPNLLLGSRRKRPLARTPKTVSIMCPPGRSVIFGHHFTSIAGTGPIVGPAIAVFWGWLPALLWILFGCVFIGAVHDFGALVGFPSFPGRIHRRRRRTHDFPHAHDSSSFLILFLSLTVVIGIFGLVIAVIFAQYPQTVLGVWISMPLAVCAGLLDLPERRPSPVSYLWPPCLPSISASFSGSGIFPLPSAACRSSRDPKPPTSKASVPPWSCGPSSCWSTASLPASCPSEILLQPRDYINSQAIVRGALFLLSWPASSSPAPNWPPPPTWLIRSALRPSSPSSSLPSPAAPSPDSTALSPREPPPNNSTARPTPNTSATRRHVARGRLGRAGHSGLLRGTR